MTLTDTTDRNCPTRQRSFWKLTLTRTPDPNRSTYVSYINVDGISLYSVDRKMVVVGEMSYTIKKESDIVQGQLSGGVGLYPGNYVQRKCPDSI